MHEIGVVGHRHVFLVHDPAHILAQDLAIFGRTSDARAAPVLRIHEIGALQGLHLVILHASRTHELRIQFIAFRMRDHEVHVRGIHPFREGIGHGLRQGARMRRPGHHHLRSLHGLILLDRDQVREGLTGMHGRRLQADDRLAGIIDELAQDGLRIVEGPVRQARKGAHADDVAIAPDDGNGFPQVLGLVAVHHDAQFRLQLPAVRPYIENDGVHAQVERSFLAAQARAQAAVEKDQHDGLVSAQGLPG